MKLLPRRNLSTKARSKKSERAAAKTLGGKVQPASGALPCLKMKADVKTDRFLVDDKITNKESFSITLKLWKKLAKEAWGNSRRPMIRVCFTSGPNLYVVDEQTLLEILNQENPPQ